MAGASPSVAPRRQPTSNEFVEMQSSREFGELRSAYRKFAFPMTVAFFLWYVLYVVMAVFAPDFMGIELGGHWNVGLVFGLLQFVTTFLITWVYIRYANKNIEPRSTAIREALEG